MNKKESDWGQVSLPKTLLARVDELFKERGYRSRAEYVRIALLKQVDKDEELVKE